MIYVMLNSCNSVPVELYIMNPLNEYWFPTYGLNISVMLIIGHPVDKQLGDWEI